MQKYYFWKNNELYLNIYLKPRSKKNMIAGIYNDKLKIFLTSPPVDGAANEHLIEFLAKYLHVTKSQIVIIKGLTSMNKVVCIKNAGEVGSLKKLYP